MSTDRPGRDPGPNEPGPYETRAGEPTSVPDEPGTLPPGSPTVPEQSGDQWQKVKHTRAAATWTGLVIGILVLIVLLIFILQNLESTDIQIFGWHGTLPLGVLLLLAAIAGAVIMALAGGIRILQVRRAARRR
ncbi:lipopolysaccharide assembly protein LapA domain-containing protein [Rhodococcus sp. HNM0569]|uniref:lipopolysaccharide assembly protein LapA domain-containing protein n=1 Tax=Rhodococcus sp. HNM0569 TaxID=2716340 RepID=UPI00146C68C0|nr:lipopolysaccharide assembly protein LapA domain-containing protein [Rhodococcus sp. HNM0569]NLU81518.1 DUF1049 domain-containing protein [Rhodococcus sp. HNM0569]